MISFKNRVFNEFEVGQLYNNASPQIKEAITLAYEKGYK